MFGEVGGVIGGYIASSEMVRDDVNGSRDEPRASQDGMVVIGCVESVSRWRPLAVRTAQLPAPEFA